MPYRLVQQHAATVFAQAEAAAGTDLRQFVKDAFDAVLEWGILAHGLSRLRCGDCGHDKLLVFSCKRRGFYPSSGARHMARSAAHLMDHVFPHLPVHRWQIDRQEPAVRGCRVTLRTCIRIFRRQCQPCGRDAAD